MKTIINVKSGKGDSFKIESDTSVLLGEDIRGTKLEKLLRKAEQDIKKGKNISKEFHSVKEAIRYLDA